MKKIYISIVTATVLTLTLQASDYINESWGFKDFEAKKVYKPTTLSVQAINQAISEASEDGGGTVVLPEGVLNANNPIIIKDNVKLKGTLKGGRRVTSINANYDIASGKRGLIISYHTTNTTIENLNLDVKGHNLTAISYAEGDQHNFLIANNSIKNAGFPKYEVAQANGTLPNGYSPMDGISLHDWGEKVYSTDFTIKDNSIENYSEHGINLHFVRRFIIDHNTMKNGIMGMDISTGSREGEVLNNDISDVVAGAKIIGNRGAYNQDIYFHNNYSHDNPKVAYHDDVSGGTYDDGGRGLERQFEGAGIHIYDNILKGYDKRHDMLYFSGAEKNQDDLHGNNEIENPIQTKPSDFQQKPTEPNPKPKPVDKDTNSKLGISVHGNNVIFAIHGKIEKGSHVQFFIDSDNNPNTGFSNEKVKGADYVIEEDHLMKSTQNSSAWKWKVVKWGLKTTQTTKKATVQVPAKVCDMINKKHIDIKITGSTINKRWQKKSRKYFGSQKYQFDLRPTTKEPKPELDKPDVVKQEEKPALKVLTDIKTKAFIPKLDFTKSDVYENGQVVYVSSTKQLQQAVVSSKPNTTIILKDGEYKNMHISFPKSKHHITIKAQNIHKAKLYPKGRDDNSAIYFPQVSKADEMIHDINFVGLEVVGEGGSREFVFTPGVQYGHHHIYFKNIKMHGLFMGVYSGLSSHDWTMDGCEFYNSTASYMWYMMGYHQAVINSVMYNNSYYSLSIRGCYPQEEKFDYYNHANNPRISSRKRHFLSSDDWTHLIANNTFGSNYNNERLADAHISLYYNADEGERDSEDVYFPPKNVMIFNNAFVDSGEGEKKMLNLMANRGIDKGRVDSIDGLIIKNNFTDKKMLVEADTGISSLDLSTNHRDILEEKFGFDDTNRDYHISYDSILKDAGTNNPSSLPWDFENKKRDNKKDVGAYEVRF
jgi:hypothetical protein